LSDQLDEASELEQKVRDIALKKQQQQKEKPLFIKGVRCCLDCEEVIPIERVNSVDAVRCIMCQVFHEATQKHQRG